METSTLVLLTLAAIGIGVAVVNRIFIRKPPEPTCRQALEAKRVTAFDSYVDHKMKAQEHAALATMYQSQVEWLTTEISNAARPDGTPATQAGFELAPAAA